MEKDKGSYMDSMVHPSAVRIVEVLAEEKLTLGQARQVLRRAEELLEETPVEQCVYVNGISWEEVELWRK